MQIQPYLFFDGRCEEALGFYGKALGAKVKMMMRYKESPEKGGMPPGSDDKVMHCAFSVGDTEVLASDGHCTGHPDFKGVSLTLTTANPDEAKKLFNALAEGGQVRAPLGKTFFSPAFGMVADKFGVSWMVYALA